MTTREVAFLDHEEIVAVHPVNGLRIVLQPGSDSCPLVYADSGSWSYCDAGGRQLADLEARVTPEILAWWERALVGRRIGKADVRHAVLELRMVDGTILRAPPDDRYEGWQVQGAGALVISLPGGELTVFEGEDRATRGA